MDAPGGPVEGMMLSGAWAQHYQAATCCEHPLFRNEVRDGVEAWFEGAVPTERQILTMARLPPEVWDKAVEAG